MSYRAKRVAGGLTGAAPSTGGVSGASSGGVVCSSGPKIPPFSCDKMWRVGPWAPERRRRALEDAKRKRHEAWVGCKEYDLVTISVDIPALGVKRGEAGLVRDLDLKLCGDVIATLELVAPTGLTKGWVEMEVRPTERVLSCSPAA